MKYGAFQPIFSEEDSDLRDTHWSLSRGYPSKTVNRDGRRVFLMAHVIVGRRMGLYSNRHTAHIDHINRNKLDCRRENLRLVSPRWNRRNSDRSDVQYEYIQGGWRYLRVARYTVCKYIKTKEQGKQLIDWQIAGC